MEPVNNTWRLCAEISEINNLHNLFVFFFKHLLHVINNGTVQYRLSKQNAAKMQRRKQIVGTVWERWCQLARWLDNKVNAYIKPKLRMIDKDAMSHIFLEKLQF